jgi:hypothetical protein
MSDKLYLGGSVTVGNLAREFTPEDEQNLDNVVAMFANAHKTPKCPVCGRDADYFTSDNRKQGRYSCCAHGHVITSPWSEIVDAAIDDEVKTAAQREWFLMMNEIMKPAANTSSAIPVLQDWVGQITRRQQGVLILGLRGPDGFYKEHPCKDTLRSFRACVMNSGIDGKPMDLDQHYEHDLFMRMDLLASADLWDQTQARFYSRWDEYNSHFILHFLHAAAVLGFHHPIPVVRERWHHFYLKGCKKAHMNPESREQFEHRLRDGDRGVEEE